jgi:hypothetical protein
MIHSMLYTSDILLTLLDTSTPMKQVTPKDLLDDGGILELSLNDSDEK